MTTRLDKTLKREITLEGRTFILAVSPEGLKLTLKGKRKGQELRWGDLVSGDAALATALNASLGTFSADAGPAAAEWSRPAEPAARKPASPPRRAEPPARMPGAPPRKSAKRVRTTAKRAPRARKR
jgi:predicted component of type VI protein secretion system